MIKVSASALRAYLRCPREYWLSHRERAERDVPAYVTAGSALDVAVQRYLAAPRLCACKGAWGAACVACAPEDAELRALTPHLPRPGTVQVQPALRMPCPGLPGVEIYGALDWLDVRDDAAIVGDLKRISDAKRALTVETLPDDIQAQLYAWLVRRLHGVSSVVWRWTYCDRRPKAWVVEVEADSARVDAWFERIVLPAARAMLDMQGPAVALEHAPDSCSHGRWCFVARHCAMYEGPLRGEPPLINLLDKYRTKAVQLELPLTRVAINPPAPEQSVPIAPPAPEPSVTIAPPAPEPRQPRKRRVRAAHDTEPCPPPAAADPLAEVSTADLAIELARRLCQ
jgi:hypothetical protein